MGGLGQTAKKLRHQQWALAIAVCATSLWSAGAVADDSSALLPLVNQGVSVAEAVQIDQGLRIALAAVEPNLQPQARTVAIVEGARASGMDCEIQVAACALQMGALANVPVVYVARILPHEDRGYWLELQRLDVVARTELATRRAAVTLDEPGFTTAMDLIAHGVIDGTDVETDLRTQNGGLTLDLGLYVGAGAAVFIGAAAALGAAGTTALAYANSGKPINSVDEATRDVETVRLLSTTAIALGVGAGLLVATGVGLGAAGLAVTSNLFEE